MTAVLMLFTFGGKKLLNQVYPTVSISITLLEDLAGNAQSYRGHIEFLTNTGKVSVTGAANQTGDFDAIATMPFPVASSTLVSFGMAEIFSPRLVSIGGQIQVQDPYDGSFHPQKESAIPAGVFNTVKSMTFIHLVELVSRSRKQMRLAEEGEDIVLTVPQVPRSEIFGSGSGYGDLTFRLSGRELNQVKFDFQETAHAERSATGAFSEFNAAQSEIPSPRLLNEFGGFIARESVYLRTNYEGEFDSLWFTWEKSHYGCSLCVNRYGDSDGDGLLNMHEFIFGSDPREMNTAHSEHTDKELLDEGKNPINGELLQTSYREAADAILNKTAPGTAALFPELAAVRDAALYRKVAVPPGATLLVFDYTFTSDESYLSVHFDDELLATVFPNKRSGLLTKEIDVRSLAGKTGGLYIVLNSVGRRGSEFFVTNLRFLNGR